MPSLGTLSTWTWLMAWQAFKLGLRLVVITLWTWPTLRSFSVSASWRGHIAVLILFLAILFISFMLAQYSCIAGCSKTYEKSASLMDHKNRCLIVLELCKKGQEIRVQKEGNEFSKHMNLSEQTQWFVVCFLYLFIQAWNCHILTIKFYRHHFKVPKARITPLIPLLWTLICLQLFLNPS